MNSTTQKEQYSLEELGIELGDNGRIKSFIEEKFLEKFLLGNELVRDKEENYYMFNKVYWEELSQDELVKNLKKFMDLAKIHLWRPHHEKSLLHYMKLEVKVVEELNPYRYIMPFKDFDFNFKTGLAEDKDSKRYFTYTKNYVEKEMEMETPVFDRLMNDISQGDSNFKKYLIEMMAILISGENKNNLVFMIYGNGANSKSLFSKLIEHLVGRQFVASRKVESFTSQFGLQGLDKVKLVTCGESETARPVDFSMIKSISGNDTVQVEGKFQAIKSLELSINFLFLTNKLYKIADKSAGITRRLQVMEFTHQVAEEDRDPDLFEKLTSETAGIFGKILNTYFDMISDEGKLNFKMSENVREFTQNYMDKYLVSGDGNNSEQKEKCIDFINVYFETGTNEDRIIKTKVYDLYCKEIEDISEALFWKNVKNTLDSMNVKIKKNIERFLVGIKIKSEYSNLISSVPTLASRRVTNILPQNLSIDEVI